jgi:hypothetical protein
MHYFLVRRDLRYSHYLNRSAEEKANEIKPSLSVPGKWKSGLNVGLKLKKKECLRSLKMTVQTTHINQSNIHEEPTAD